MLRKLSVELIRLLLILLFVYAAAIKLLEYNKFVVQIGLSPLIPSFLHRVAWFIPAVELIIALALMFEKTLRPGLYGSLCIMSVFTLYIIGIFTVASHIPCSCGGILESMSWTDHLIFNVAFVFISAIGIVLVNRESKVDLKVSV